MHLLPEPDARCIYIRLFEYVQWLYLMKWSQWSSEDIVTKVREAMSTGSGILKCIRAEWDIQLLAGCKVEQNQTIVHSEKRDKVSMGRHTPLIEILAPVLWRNPANTTALCTRTAAPDPSIGEEVRARGADGSAARMPCIVFGLVPC